jgi:hypothetical protein
MNAFLDSLRADLLDRRLRPVLAVLGVALLGAVAYAAFGGSSAPSQPPASSPATARPTAPIAVSPANTEGAQAIAETTGGTGGQSGGATRNPFTPLPQPNVARATPVTASGPASSSPSTSASATAGPSTGSSGSKAGAQTESSSPSSGGAAPAKPKPTPAKPRSVYEVAALFGAAPAGTPIADAALTPYDKLALQQPLPSAKQPLVVFRGVVAGAKSAAFTLVGEAIIRGPGACRPSSAQCQVIDLQKGQTEELEYVPLGGTPTTYLLHIVGISSAKAGASAAHAARVDESQAGLKLLREAGLQAMPGLRYSRTKGVLVFAARTASVARAAVASPPVLDSAPQALSAST